MIIRLLLVLQLFIAQQGFSKIITKSLFINAGQFNTVKNFKKFPYLSFNSSTVFNKTSEVLSGEINDSLIITIQNTDTIVHHFAIKNLSIAAKAILPGKTEVIKLKLIKEGIFIYHDPLAYPKNAYLGLAGMLCVYKNTTSVKNYFWNIREHQSIYNADLSKGKVVSWDNYYPDFFTVNGLSFPDTESDTIKTSVHANVGDTIHLYVSNTGQSEHALHFHGYHCKILFSSKNENHKGWIKDTFPLMSMESMILELVPDQPGEYGVHDHNLVAMTGNSVHPYGMMLLLKIK